jgi:hypothetical protein
MIEVRMSGLIFCLAVSSSFSPPALSECRFALKNPHKPNSFFCAEDPYDFFDPDTNQPGYFELDRIINTIQSVVGKPSFSFMAISNHFPPINVFCPCEADFDSRDGVIVYRVINNIQNYDNQKIDIIN